MKRRLLAIGMICALLLSMAFGGAVASSDWADLTAYMEYVLRHTYHDPVMSINVAGKRAAFEYSDGLRVKYTYDGVIRTFIYSDGKLIRQSDNETIDFIYENEECVGVVFHGEEYRFRFGDDKSVSGLINSSGVLICEYIYSGAEASVTVHSSNAMDSAIAERNPIRYQGWYYDIETEKYYLGDGMYYDPSGGRFIQNHFRIDTRGGEPVIFETVTAAYSAMMGSSTYGATLYDFPSQSAWNSGSRWYSGIQPIELLARCIFAENSGTNRSNDRKAIGLVIRNRVAQNFPHNGSLSPYSIICYPSAFATVNPGSYSGAEDSTKTARGVMSKTNTAFQQATFIACALYYTTSYSDYSLLVGIPAYMTSGHTHFLSVNHAYGNAVLSVDTSGSSIQWKYGSTNIYGVCIAGTAQLTSFGGSGAGCLQTYYLNGYNVFFKYSP